MENDLIIPKATTEDTIHKAVKVVISAVPYVGGPIVEILNAIIKTPVQKRQEQLIESIIDKIKTLEKDFEELKPENLSQNELFITILLKSLQAITKEHQKEKINAFKNSIINSVTIEFISEDYKLLFLSYLESFTVIHIQILKFIHDILHVRTSNDTNYYSELGQLYTSFNKPNNSIKISKETFLSIIEELKRKDFIREKANYSIVNGKFVNYTLIDSPLTNEFIFFTTGYFD